MLSVLAVVLVLAACQTQVTLEPAPEAIAFAANPQGECDPYTAYWKADNWGEDDWGGRVQATEPLENSAISIGLDDYPPTFTYTNNSDMDLVRIVVKAGQEADVSNDPGDSGSITWDAPPAISHVTFCFDDGGGDTTTAAGGGTSTAPDGDTTTAAGGGTTTAPDRVTTTAAGEATTTAPDGETSITQGGGATTSAPGGDTTTTEGSGAVNPTTTVEVGAGEVTTTPGGEGEGEGTLDPSQESSTTGEEVGGGSGTLPNTGTGQASLSGLAGLLLGAGAILLMLVRRRSRED